jgi:hypothetical protein
MGCPLILAARLLASGDANSVPGAGSRGTSGGGLELRPSSSGSMLPCFLPPSPCTLRWRPPSLPVSAASLLPSASAMRRSSSSATLERRATRVEGTAGSPRCGEEAASSGEGEGHSSTATAARSSFHDSEHRRKVVGAAAADAWWGRRRLTEPPPSLRIWRNWRPTPF